MNNSSDFQPPTRNPQSNVGGGLQTSGANLQPGTSSSQAGELNPNILPLTTSLKVTTASNGSSTQLAPSTDLQVTSAISSGWFFAVVTILTIIIFWVLGKLFNSPKKAKPTAIVETPVVKKSVSKAVTKKKSKKKPNKKNYKKRK